MEMELTSRGSQLISGPLGSRLESFGMNWFRIRVTHPQATARGVRWLLGALFLMTGAMKLVVPMLASAWAGQLEAAQIPMAELSRWIVPFVEMGVGLALSLGFHTRIASLIVLGIMTVATYVHLVVDDPTLFPLQPTEPIIPVVVMVLALFLLVKGGGSGSLDLRAHDGAASYS